jgi:hypothetical protein
MVLLYDITFPNIDPLLQDSILVGLLTENIIPSSPLALSDTFGYYCHSFIVVHVLVSVRSYVTYFSDH